MSVPSALVVIGEHTTPSSSTETFQLFNPSTEAALTEVAQCNAADVDRAVAAASTAQVAWWRMSPDERSTHLLAWADRIMAEGEDLGRLDTLSVGRPIRDTVKTSDYVARLIRYWAGMMDKFRNTQLPVAPGHLVYTRREPLGVVAVLLPWNGPAPGFAERVVPALACGNAVVAKPSELSPLSAIRLAEMALEAGMPAGLVNVVTGDGRTGGVLSRHPGVTGISFTGSLEGGRAVNRAAAETLKKVTLELGGKSPNIVFADADLEAALAGTTWGVFFNSGQVCVAGTRLLVERCIVDEFVGRLHDLSSQLVVGDPFDPRTHMGPLASATQHDRVHRYVSLGLEEGAHLIEGSGVEAALPESGYYVRPTIFTDVSPTSRLAQEEVFGPVLSVIPFDDETEVVRIANDTRYGLSANVWTSNIGRMLRIVEELDVGNVWGNTKQLSHPAMPFGGFKQSGLGNAGGDEAIEANTQVKAVAIRFDSGAPAPSWDDIAEPV